MPPYENDRHRHSKSSNCHPDRSPGRMANICRSKLVNQTRELTNALGNKLNGLNVDSLRSVGCDCLDEQNYRQTEIYYLSLSASRPRAVSKGRKINKTCAEYLSNLLQLFPARSVTNSRARTLVAAPPLRPGKKPIHRMPKHDSLNLIEIPRTSVPREPQRALDWMLDTRP